MANDTTIQSVFAHVKLPRTHEEFPRQPTVYATYVEHFPNSHPAGSTTEDSVRYGAGPLKLSADTTTLFGELNLWRNISSPAVDADAGDLGAVFADADKATHVTIAITVSDSGQVTYQDRLDGHPIGGLAPRILNASFVNAIFVETDPSPMRSLSFTLGLL